MLCILYTIAVGTCLGITGLMFERMLPEGAPRRWIWCATIVLSMTIPPLYRFHHTTAVTGPWRLTQWHDPLMISWEAVSLLLVCWAMLSAWHISRVVHRARNQSANVDGVEVIVTDKCGPAAVGVFRSRVVMPRWVFALPRAQRQYIVRHEEEHRKAHDAALLMLTSVAVVLTPWNLPVWWQLRRLSLAVEMDCDQRVVRSLGDANAYGELLLQVAEVKSRSPRLQPALVGRVSLLERRLEGLFAPAVGSQGLRLLLAIFALVLLGIVLAAPHPMPGAH